MIEEHEVEVDVFIENSKNSHIKYKYDNKLKALVCDKIFHKPFNCQFNYGCISHTLAADGNPLEVVVLMDDELVPGSYIKCKFLGALEQGSVLKIIMCPSIKVDPVYTNYDSLVRYILTQDFEKKNSRIGNWLQKDDAISLYLNSVVHELD